MPEARSDGWFDELAELLRIPSMSADPAHAADVVRAGQWVCDFIRDAGGECELVDWHGQPLAIGELRASTSPETAPTVLCYGHFDVQPPDPLELWESDPFEPEIRGDYLYARGAVDDKGQLYMLLGAARELAQAGELPVNVRFCCDGEEETGGHSIVDFLAADERGADAAVIFDSGMIRRDVPAFNLATRGMAYFHLTLRTGDRDLHSGMYGGAALNAAHAMVRDARHADRARRDARRPAAQGHRRADRAGARGLGAAPGRVAELGEQGARPKDERAAEDFYVRTFAEPALDVNGIQTGSPRAAEDRAAGRGDRKRLDPARARPAGRRRSRRRSSVSFARPRRAGAELDVELWSSAAPGLVPPDSRAVQLGLDAFERALGRGPR